MLYALRKVREGDITTAICEAGMWYVNETDIESLPALTNPDIQTTIFSQIAIAISYGYIAGQVRNEGDKIIYTGLVLTRKGEEFLATMKSALPDIEMKKSQGRTKYFATVAIAGSAILVSILFSVFKVS